MPENLVQLAAAKSKSVVLRHLQKWYPDFPRYACDECPGRFRTSDEQRDHKYDSCDKTLTSTCGLRPHVLNYHERVSILAWKLLRTSRQRLFNRNHCAIVDAQQLYFMIRVYEMMCKRPEDRPEDWLGILQQTPDPAINRFQSILTARKRKGQQRRGIEQVKRNEEGIEI